MWFLEALLREEPSILGSNSLVTGLFVFKKTALRQSYQTKQVFFQKKMMANEEGILNVFADIEFNTLMLMLDAKFIS